jgi:hypothetical protein
LGCLGGRGYSKQGQIPSIEISKLHLTLVILEPAKICSTQPHSPPAAQASK